MPETPGEKRRARSDGIARAKQPRTRVSQRGRREESMLGLVALVLLIAVAVGGGLARAGNGVLTTFGTSGSGAGEMSDPHGVAVNASSGSVYVVDTGNQRIDEFDTDGTFVRTWGWGVVDGSEVFQTCTSACSGGIPGGGAGQFNAPQGVAISETSGDLYVTDRENLRVQQFEADGTFVRAWGWGVADGTEEFQICESPGPCQAGTSGSGDGQFASSGANSGIALDPVNGNVYVADPGNSRIQKFGANGQFLGVIGAPGSADGEFAPDSPDRLTVDASGRVYALDSGNFRVQRFDDTGAFERVFGTDLTGEPAPNDILSNASTDRVLVLKACTPVLCPDGPTNASERRVFDFDASGTLLDSHLARAGLANLNSLARNANTDRLYVTGDDQVYVIDEVVPPTGTVGVSNVQQHTATLFGTINPQGTPTSYFFEYSADGNQWSRANFLDVEVGSGTSDIDVSVDVAGLNASTEYHVRLRVTKPLGNPGVTLTTSFVTEPDLPRLALAPTTSSIGSAVLRARIDPQHLDTTYRFEYGPTSSYGAATPNASAGTGSGFTQVSQVIAGLADNQTLHYRVVATNAAGQVASQDRTVTTGRGLPHDRGYELVSPAEKFGSGIKVDSGRTRIASDGSGIVYASLGGFSDVRGTGIANEYISQRHPGTGWATHAITPFQKPQSFNRVFFGGLDPRYLGEFSEDLDKGVFLSNRLLSNEGANVGNIPNLYLRRDIRTPGVGTYELLTDSFTPNTLTAQQYRPWFAGASKNFTHIVFTSVVRLTPDSPSQPPNCYGFPFFSGIPCQLQVYEWVEGLGIRLVGILPEGEGGGVATRSIAGHGRGFNIYMPNIISRDGRRIFFTEQAGADFSDGRLYMREDGVTTLRINASERDTPDAEQPAKYWDASADGSVVYFTTVEKLTDDANASDGRNLYRWERDASEGERLTLISVDNEPRDGSNEVIGVIGTNADGAYVYFIGATQLVRGEPVRPEGGDLLLFAWHDGEVAYIGTAVSDSELAPRTGWGGVVKTARVTPDGKQFLFTSRSRTGLTGQDNGTAAVCPSGDGSGGCNEVYVYSAEANDGKGELACASCSPQGTPAKSNATIMHETSGATSSALPRAMSDDGRLAFFTSGEPLVPEDRNGRVNDVYVYDVVNGKLDLVSAGSGESSSYFLGVSATGNDVFFATRDRLVSADVDNSIDVYDARVGGGFAEEMPPPRCVEERCRGPLGPAPVLPPLGGSLIFRGPNGALSEQIPTFHVRRLGARQLRRLASGATVRVRVNVSETGRVRGVLRAQLGNRMRVVASGSARAPRGGTIRIRLGLNRRARAQLRTAGTLRAVIVVRYSLVAQAQREQLTLRATRGGR